MIWASQAAPYIVAAYALTLIVILAYVASIRARRSAVRRDLAAALEALDGFQGGPSGGQTPQRADSQQAESQQADSQQADSTQQANLAQQADSNPSLDDLGPT